MWYTLVACQKFSRSLMVASPTYPTLHHCQPPHHWRLLPWRRAHQVASPGAPMKDLMGSPVYNMFLILCLEFIKYSKQSILSNYIIDFFSISKSSFMWGHGNCTRLHCLESVIKTKPWESSCIPNTHASRQTARTNTHTHTPTHSWSCAQLHIISRWAFAGSKQPCNVRVGAESAFWWSRFINFNTTCRQTWCIDWWLIHISGLPSPLRRRRWSEVGGVGLGLQPTLLLSTSRARSRLSKQQKNAAASPAVTPSFFFSQIFSIFFHFQMCVSKWQQMKTGVRTRFSYSIFNRGLKKILNKYWKSRGKKGPITMLKGQVETWNSLFFFTEWIDTWIHYSGIPST